MDKTASRGRSGRHPPGAPGDSKPADFGQWLKAWRHTNRVSQRELAEALGYDVTYVAKIEGGVRPPTRQFFARLAQVAGTPEEPLLRASADDLSRPPLPCPPDALVGREAELDDVVARLTTGARCVTLVGPPGIGKTRLATEVATQLDAVFLSGAWWVSLVDVVDPDAVVLRVRQELGVANRGEGDPVHGLVERLRGHQALLVLDNFEHVLAARPLVSALAAGAPSLAVLVTSREPLGLVSEHVYPIGPLGCPDLASSPSLTDIGTATAVRLYVARATMADPAFALGPENCEAVARTCAHLDGIPLALVLAAGEARTEGVAGIERRAGQHTGWSPATATDLPPHHRTLDTAISSSWLRLDPGEADLFARLAVFRGGFTRHAAAAVAPSASAEGAPPAAALDALVRKSLVEPRPDALGGPRFELLETIRAFAHGRLRESGALDDARRRHLEYFASMARRAAAGLLGHEQASSLQALALEIDNVRAAFEWAVTTDPVEALGLASSMWRYFLVRDVPAGRRWLERALAAAPAPSPSRAEALAAAGALAWVAGEPELSEACLDEALRLAGDHGVPGVAALAWLNKGALGEQRGTLDEADRCFVEALALYQSLGDDRGRACALIGRGMICRRRGAIDDACEFWTTAVQLFAAVGDRFNQTMAIGNLAWAAEQEGRLDEAFEWLTDCRRMRIALGDARGLASVTADMSRLAYKRGAYEAAIPLAAEALVGFHHLGDRPWAASTIVTLAAALARRGDHRRAVRLLAAAGVLWELMGATPRAEDDALRAEVTELCRQHLQPGEMARAAGAGRAMSLGDVVQFARDHA